MERRTKDVIQAEAFEAWELNGEHGLIGNCTGSGKSRIAIMAARKAYNEKLPGTKFRILLVTYTITSGKVDWPAEFEAAGEKMLLKYVTHTCYASLHTMKGQWSLVILDEAHHLTPKSYKFFMNNPQPRIMMLTATPPDEEKELGKLMLLESLGPVVYTYPLDEAIKDGNAADYRLWIIDMVLDDKDKYIQAGTKANPFMTTELKQYEFINKQILIAQKANNKGWLEALYQKRMHFMNGLKSKTVLAKKILARVAPDKRVLIFAASIAQTSELCPYTYHSQTDSTDLNLFREGQINRIACVKALNEAVNLSDLDNSLIVQANSRIRDFIQRMGRNLRFRPNYVADIWLLRALNTVDVKWIEDAISTLDPAKIKYYSASNIK